ncbi:hypothetical protein IAT38_005831 [Cryptococcus sp. DSM 104549]
MGVLQRIRGYILLNDPTWSEEKRREKVLVRKLDIFFMTYAMLSAIVKYLDQTNISNAYVSGMQEDLKLFSNELNFFTTYYNIGYMICIPLSAYFINGRIRPSLFMPVAELIWGVATAGLSAAKTSKHVYGLRFLVGFWEGTAWPGTMVLLLSWYTPAEIGKRLALYQSATSLGGIFSGALQAALYTNLNGAHGIAGWRWLFIVNAVITIVVAAWGFIGCPDYPNALNPWAKWIKPADLEAANRRMAYEGRALPRGWTWKTVKATFTRPTNIGIWLAYTLAGQGGTGTGYFNLWLKSLKNSDGTKRYTVSQLNTIPIAGTCITIVSLLTVLAISDKFRVQWPFLIAVCTIGLIFTSILAAWTVSDSVKFASFLVLNICTVYATLTIAWIGTLIKHSAEERSAIIASLVTTFYVLGACVPLKVWPAKQAPTYKIGWKYAAAMYAASIPVILLVRWLQIRKDRQEAEERSAVDNVEEQIAVEDDDRKSGSDLETPDLRDEVVHTALKS